MKFQIKPYRSGPKVTNVVLIEKLGETANLKLERLTKMKKAILPKPIKLIEVKVVEHPCSSRHQYGKDPKPGNWDIEEREFHDQGQKEAGTT